MLYRWFSEVRFSVRVSLRGKGPGVPGPFFGEGFAEGEGPGPGPIPVMARKNARRANPVQSMNPCTPNFNVDSHVLGND